MPAIFCLRVPNVRYYGKALAESGQGHALLRECFLSLRYKIEKED
jgi:hypothetical protein